MLEQAQASLKHVPKCPANLDLRNNFFSPGYLQQFRSGKLQASHLYSYLRFFFFFFPLGSKGKEEKHGEQGGFSAGVSLRCSRRKQFSDTN